MKKGVIKMDELKKINAKITVKQLGRIVGAFGCMFLATRFFTEFVYQKGITDCQKSISKEFPDEYAAMTEKVVKTFEKY